MERLHSPVASTKVKFSQTDQMKWIMAWFSRIAQDLQSHFTWSNVCGPHGVVVYCIDLSVRTNSALNIFFEQVIAAKGRLSVDKKKRKEEETTTAVVA